MSIISALARISALSAMSHYGLGDSSKGTATIEDFKYMPQPPIGGKKRQGRFKPKQFKQRGGKRK